MQVGQISPLFQCSQRKRNTVWKPVDSHFVPEDFEFFALNRHKFLALNRYKEIDYFNIFNKEETRNKIESIKSIHPKAFNALLCSIQNFLNEYKNKNRQNSVKLEWLLNEVINRKTVLNIKCTDSKNKISNDEILSFIKSTKNLFERERFSSSLKELMDSLEEKEASPTASATALLKNSVVSNNFSEFPLPENPVLHQVADAVGEAEKDTPRFKDIKEEKCGIKKITFANNEKSYYFLSKTKKLLSSENNTPVKKIIYQNASLRKISLDLNGKKDFYYDKTAYVITFKKEEEIVTRKKYGDTNLRRKTFYDTKKKQKRKYYYDKTDKEGISKTKNSIVTRKGPFVEKTMPKGDHTAESLIEVKNRFGSHPHFQTASICKETSNNFVLMEPYLSPEHGWMDGSDFKKGGYLISLEQANEVGNRKLKDHEDGLNNEDGKPENWEIQVNNGVPIRFLERDLELQDRNYENYVKGSPLYMTGGSSFYNNYCLKNYCLKRKNKSFMTHCMEKFFPFLEEWIYPNFSSGEIRSRIFSLFTFFKTFQEFLTHSPIIYKEEYRRDIQEFMRIEVLVFDLFESIYIKKNENDNTINIIKNSLKPYEELFHKIVAFRDVFEKDSPLKNTALPEIL